MITKKNYIREFRVKKITLGNGEHYFQVEWRMLGVFKWKWKIHDFKLETMEEALEVIENTTKTDNKEYKLKTEFCEL